MKLAVRCDAEPARGGQARSAAAAAPACACCRAAATSASAAIDAPARAGQAGCDGCVHVALGVELGMPPEGAAVAVVVPAAFAAAVPLFAVASGEAHRVQHPPATGPPRCDRRTRLRASTLLLL